MYKLIDRFKEPSSHAGIAALAQALAVIFPQYAYIFGAITVIFGGAAITTPERGA